MSELLKSPEMTRMSELMLEAIGQAVVAIDLTGRVMYWNAAATACFGWSADEAMGRNVADFIKPDLTEEEALAVFEVLSSGQKWSAECIVEHRDGRRFPVLLAESGIHSEDGELLGIIGVTTDLSDLRSAEQAHRESESRLQAVIYNSPVVLISFDEEGSITFAEGWDLNANGPSPHNVVGIGLTHIAVAAPDAADAVRRALAGESTDNVVTFRGRKFDLRCRPKHDGDGNIVGVLCVASDITDTIEADERLRESEARYRLIAETAQEGIWATDPEGQTLYANQKMAELLGCSTLDFYGRPSWELVSGTTGDGFHERLARRDENGPDSYELSHTRPDGSARILHVAVSPFIDEDRRLGSLAMVSDITEARAAEESLRHRAYHDSLTGLANRGLLVEELQQSLGRASRAKTVAVLVADIDQFKLINDSFGHAAGDELLLEVSRRWQHELGANAVLARLGGDEFALGLEVDVETARRLAARLMRALRTPIELGGHSVTVNASIGIAVAEPFESADAETLLRYADAAMYEAKAKGRSRIEVFSPCLIDRAQNRLQLFNDLKEAIDNDGLVLQYQPVVELATGRMLGVEALCRWTHPKRGFVPPDVFIAAAEDSGLIDVLDRWVLGRACRDNAAMRLAGVLPEDAYVAVNVSARTLAQSGFESVVHAALRKVGLPAHALVIEVTESAVMDDPDAAKGVLESLRKLGIHVAIDDFGTGYSSLAYLRRFPVSTLKIDRSFIQNISSNPEDQAIVTAIIDLSGALKVATTAEGIETTADLGLLQQLGCFAGQGFLWSPAVSPDRLAVLMDDLPARRFPIEGACETGIDGSPLNTLPPPRRPAEILPSIA